MRLEDAIERSESNIYVVPMFASRKKAFELVSLEKEIK